MKEDLTKIKDKRNFCITFSGLSLLATTLKLVRNYSFENGLVIDSPFVLSGSLTIIFVSGIFYYQKKYKKMELMHNNPYKTINSVKKIKSNH